MVIATARLPYGYYTFLRIVTCVAGILFAIAAWNSGRIGQVLAVATLLLAILFNPIIPVHLRRADWFYLNILGAVLFVANSAFIWTKSKAQAPTAPSSGPPSL